jgi:hypothetical protein
MYQNSLRYELLHCNNDFALVLANEVLIRGGGEWSFFEIHLAFIKLIMGESVFS